MSAGETSPHYHTRLLGPRLPFGAQPIRPAQVGSGLAAAMLAQEHLLEDANYQKIAPNEFIVELSEANYARSYKPIAERLNRQWQAQLQAHLETANSRQGRVEYRLAGPLHVSIRPTSDLKDYQARLLCRVAPQQPTNPELPACLEAENGVQRWPLHIGRLTIGRGAQNDITLTGPEIHARRLVSEQHAYLDCQPDHYHLSDGSPGGRPSTNGTFVNDRRVPPTGVDLQDGDLIVLATLNPNSPDPHTPGVVALRFRSDCSHESA